MVLNRRALSFIAMDLSCLECNNGDEAVFGVAEMTIEQLRKAYRAEPFKPFTISLTDGRRFYVGHQEYLSIAPQAQRTFVVASEGEEYSVVDLLLVTSLDYKNARPNGRSRRKKS